MKQVIAIREVRKTHVSVVGVRGRRGVTITGAYANPETGTLVFVYEDGTEIDTGSIIGGNNIWGGIGGDINNQTDLISLVNAAVAAHEATIDPHPQYTTTAEAAAAAPVQSVNTKTGAVSLTAGDVGADPAGTATAAVTGHEAAPDPHPQYATAAEAAAAAPVQSVQGRVGDVLITKADVGLDQVDNTPDALKPVSSAQQAALDDKVDKVAGKGLSTEDYTTAEKNKLAALAAVASSGNAADLAVADAGGYYTSANVEGALQEVGVMMGDVSAALDAINGEVV